VFLFFEVLAEHEGGQGIAILDFASAQHLPDFVPGKPADFADLLGIEISTDISTVQFFSRHFN
jgi:hypothetical protein